MPALAPIRISKENRPASHMEKRACRDVLVIGVLSENCERSIVLQRSHLCTEQSYPLVAVRTQEQPHATVASGAWNTNASKGPMGWKSVSRQTRNIGLSPSAEGGCVPQHGALDGLGVRIAFFCPEPGDPPRGRPMGRQTPNIWGKAKTPGVLATNGPNSHRGVTPYSLRSAAKTVKACCQHPANLATLTVLLHVRASLAVVPFPTRSWLDAALLSPVLLELVSPPPSSRRSSVPAI